MELEGSFAQHAHCLAAVRLVAHRPINSRSRAVRGSKLEPDFLPSAKHRESMQQINPTLYTPRYIWMQCMLLSPGRLPASTAFPRTSFAQRSSNQCPIPHALPGSPQTWPKHCHHAYNPAKRSLNTHIVPFDEALAFGQILLHLWGLQDRSKHWHCPVDVLLSYQKQ